MLFSLEKNCVTVKLYIKLTNVKFRKQMTNLHRLIPWVVADTRGRGRRAEFRGSYPGNSRHCSPYGPGTLIDYRRI